MPLRAFIIPVNRRTDSYIINKNENLKGVKLIICFKLYYIDLFVRISIFFTDGDLCFYPVSVPYIAFPGSNKYYY